MANELVKVSMLGVALMTGWLARARTLTWFATATVLLLAVAYISALVVDAVEIAAPRLPVNTCAPRHGLALITAPSSALTACQWEPFAFKTLQGRKVMLQINEMGNGRFQADATVTTSPTDPIVAKVQRGDARQNGEAFEENVVGFVTVENQPLEWSVPVLKEGQGPGKVLITASGTELAPFPGSTQSSTDPVAIIAYLNNTGTMQLMSRARVVAGVQVQGNLKITGQDIHSVTAATTSSFPGGRLTVDLTSDAAQSPSFSLNPVPPGWLARTASGAWQILRGFAEAIFPAAAWIVLFLASRAGVFGSVGRRAAWRRVERTIGMVLLADFVISAAVQISNQESTTFPASLAPANLSLAMFRAGLWTPSGFTAVSGGVVLLIALTICAAGWWGRSQYAVQRVPGRVIALLTTAVGIAFAVVGFAGLAREGQLQFSQLQFGQPQPAPWPALATEIPLATLSALACAALAAAWLSGALALSKASAAKDPLTGHTAEVNAVAIGWLGKRAVVVSGSSDHTIRIWDAATGAPVGQPLTGHTAEVNAVAIGRLGKRAVVVSGSSDHTIRIWDAATGAPVGQPLTGHTAEVNAVAIGRLGKRAVVVSGSSDHTIRIWDAATGAPVGQPLTGHTAEVNAVAISRRMDSRTVVVSGSSDRTIRIWDAATGAPVGQPLTGHTAEVNAVAISRRMDSRTVVVSGSSDRTIRIWDAATGAPVGQPLTGHTAEVNAVAIDHRMDSRTVVVSGSSDRTIRIWDAATGAPVGQPLTGHTAEVNTVAIGRLGKRAVVVSGSGRTIRIGEVGPDRVPVLRRLIAVTAPVVLVSLGYAAAVVRHSGPLNADVFTLWVTGVLSIAIAVAALTAWLALRSKEKPRTGRRVTVTLIFAAALVLSLAASYLIITRFMNSDPATVSTAAVFEALIALAVVGFSGVAAASWPWRRRGGVRPAQLVALITVLAVAAALTNDGGYGPLALRWGVLIIVGAVMGLAVVRLAAGGIGWRPIRRRYLFAVLPLAALVAVPWGILHSQDVVIGWWTLLSYALRIDGILGLVLVTAVVTALCRLGSAPVTAPEELRDHRALGVAVWFIALSGAYTLAGGYNAGAVVFLGAAAFGAWLLMPTDQVPRAAGVLGQSTKMQARAVAQTLRAGAGRRLRSSLSKATQDKAAADNLTFAEAQKKILAVELHAIDRKDQLHVNGHIVRVATQQRGFGALTSSRPWQRARWGLLAGLVIGSPWVVLGLAGISLPTAQEGYPELSIAAAVAPLILRWTGYGFLFGYFFPLLRGTSGLSKALWLFVAAAIAEVCATLTSVHATVKQWDKTGLLVIQLFAFAMTLGILADRAVLNKYHFPAARLVDLHNLWWLSAWASAVGVAVATGIATVIIVGLQPFVIGVITPSSPAQPSPPSVTVSPPSGHLQKWVAGSICLAGPRRARRANILPSHRPARVGAVPQTALILVVTRRYCSGLLNFAAHSPDDSNETEDPVLRASNGPN